MSSIYLDNNATTFVDPLVTSRIQELHTLGVANPASQHRQGRAALALLEDAKTQLLEYLGAPSQGMETANIVLTSGGTEANNLAVHSLSRARPGIAIVGATEHPSVLDAAQSPLINSHPVRVLPVGSNGQHDLDLLAGWLHDDQPISFVSIMLGNNETGVIHNLPRICSLCHQHQVPVHSDVVQAVGKIPVNMSDIGLAALTITAHKLHGPVGIGALIARRDISLEPMILGGGQQLGWRAGTEPVIPAVAFAVALREIDSARRSGIFDDVLNLRDHFERAMLAIGDTTIVAAETARLPHTSNVAFHGLDRQALHMALDLAGVACSAGSACSSGSSRPSPILLAMGLPEPIVQSSLRFSFSRSTSLQEIDAAIEIIESVVARLRRKKPNQSAVSR